MFYYSIEWYSNAESKENRPKAAHHRRREQIDIPIIPPENLKQEF